MTRHGVGRSTVAIVAALMMLSWPGAIVPTRGQASNLIAEALRFRADFALNTDVDFVSALLSKSDGDDAYGTPLSPDEKALMDRRNAIPGQLGPVREYRTKHGPTWGGMWLDYSPTDQLGRVVTLNVAVTADANEVASDLASLVPVEVGLRVVEVTRTEAELDELGTRITKDLAFFESLGIAFRSASSIVSENLVQVAVSRVDDKIRAAISERYGAGAVRVVEGSPVEEDTCTRLNCGPPWKGGILIYPSGPSYCTSGFVVRANHYGVWSYAIWTSGHCGSHVWREGSASGTVVGTTAAAYFTDGGRVDVQVIPISAANAINQYISGSAGCSSTCQLYYIFYSQGQEADEPGDPVCNNGAISGSKCGKVESTNVKFPWATYNKTLYHFRSATYTRMPGDSGGPVVNNYFTAAGSHTHHEVIDGVDYAVYPHVWEMEQATGFIVYTT